MCEDFEDSLGSLYPIHTTKWKVSTPPESRIALWTPDKTTFVPHLCLTNKTPTVSPLLVFISQSTPQAETFYPTETRPIYWPPRSQTSNPNPRDQASSLKTRQKLLHPQKPDTHPEPQRTLGQIKGHVYIQNFSIQAGGHISPGPEAIRTFTVHPPTWEKSLYLATVHYSQKTREKTETKEEESIQQRQNRKSLPSPIITSNPDAWP